MADGRKACRMIAGMLDQTGELLLLLGWWVSIALAAGALFYIDLKTEPAVCWGKWGLFAAVIAGVLLPLCNYTAAPLTVFLCSRGMKQGPAAAFLVASSLLSPGAILLAWAYLGPLLTAAYLLFGLSACFVAGLCGARNGCEKVSVRPSASYLQISGRLCLWTVCGVLLQAAVTVLFQPMCWNLLMTDPQKAGALPVLAASLTRMLCIPDDIALTASLTACGLGPGCGMLLLLCGALCNIPQCLTVAMLLGKNMLKAYLLPLALIVPECLLLQLAFGAAFTPQYSLTGTEGLISTANLLTVHTPMASRPVFAVLLTAAAVCYLLWTVRKKAEFKSDLVRFHRFR
ncbi:MAG: permease [Firmicutes bacterium]|nr:permease [Bacillota bacterium]